MTKQILLRLALTTVGCAALTHCTSRYDRVNHRFSEENKRLADTALEDFDAAVGDRGALLPILLENIQAQADLERTTAGRRTKIAEFEKLQRAFRLDWLTLWQQLAYEVGYSNDELKLINAGVERGNYVNRLERTVAAYWTGRQTTEYEFAVGVLRDYRTATDKGREIDEKTKNEVIGRVREFLKRVPPPIVRRAARLGTEEIRSGLPEPLRKKTAAFVTNGLSEGIHKRIQTRVLHVLAATQILAALAEGEGALASNATKALAADTSRIEEWKGTDKESATIDVVDELRSAIRGAFRDAMTAAKGKGSADSNKPSSRGAGPTPDVLENTDVASESSDGMAALRDSLVEAAESSRDPASVYALVPLVGSGLDDKSFMLLSSFQKHLTQKLEGIENGNADERVRAALKRAQQLLKLAVHGESLDDAGKPLARFLNLDRNPVALKELSVLIEEAVGELATTDARLGRVISDARKGYDAVADLDADDLFERFSRPVRRESRRVQDRLHSVLSREFTNDAGKKTSLQQQLTDVLSHIKRGKREARQRVVEHLLALQRVRVDLHEENMRHYGVLLAVAKEELRRWQLLAEQSEKVEPLYDFGGRKSLLFADKERINEWLWFVRHKSPNHWYPRIRRDDNVLDSLRRLAAAAQEWQLDEPRKAYEEHGRHVERSNARLLEAVAILNRYLLMTVVNGRFAAANGIRLRAEIAEHDLHIDQVIARGQEAGIREALLSVAAFHGTGWTVDDVRALVTLYFALAVDDLE